MIHSETPQEQLIAAEEEDIASVYGPSDDAEYVSSLLRADFAPWHHPVKQFVRREQWLVQVRRLLCLRPGSTNFKYLGLPGADMFDVRLLGQALKGEGVELECLGFNSANDDAAAGAQMNAESALIQEGLITSNSRTLSDRLQDIAVSASHAHTQLSNWGPFDVVNFDLCGHLAAPAGAPTVLDALGKLVAHQRVTNKPWLLMLTMRVEPENLGVSRDEFSGAISRNMALNQGFSENLAAGLNFDVENLAEEIDQTWSTQSTAFVKLYSIGLGKYLLHLFHNQIQDPASVELKSCMAYRVHSESPDMLSLAFLVKPGQKREFPAKVDGDMLDLPNVEVGHALQIVRKSAQMLDLDEVLQDDHLREALIAETEDLLRGANYDVARYRTWVAEFRAVRVEQIADPIGT